METSRSKRPRFHQQTSVSTSHALLHLDDTKEEAFMKHLEGFLKDVTDEETTAILNEQDYLGRTILVIAIQRNFQKVVSKLLVSTA